MWRAILGLADRLKKKPLYILAVIAMILLFLRGGSLNFLSMLFQHSFNNDSHDTYIYPHPEQPKQAPSSEKSVIEKKYQAADHSKDMRKMEPKADGNNVAKDYFVKNGHLIWQKTVRDRVMNWPEAQEYCNNLRLDGYDNWQLPTISELTSLADKRFSPSINPIFGALPANYPPYFWSSTIDPNDNNEAQFLNFKNCLPAQINKEKGYGFVRCVRQE